MTYEDNSSYSNYLQMIIWIKQDDRVYEISYSDRKEHFSKILDKVEKMAESLRFVKNQKLLQSGGRTEVSITNSEDPILILKRRFAMGEINDEEYQRIRKMLEN